MGTAMGGFRVGGQCDFALQPLRHQVLPPDNTRFYAHVNMCDQFEMLETSQILGFRRGRKGLGEKKGMEGALT